MSLSNLFQINDEIKLKNRTSNKILKFFVISVLFFLFTVGFSVISKALSTNADVVVYPVAMMRTSSSSDSYAYKNATYRDNIKTITFEREIDIPSEALASWDVSANSDESVMAYVVTNSEDDTKYDLYIQGNGSLFANYNSRYLFANLKGLETIYNIEYLNISKTTNMESMFDDAGYNSTKFEVDLSNWNTSHVTNMFRMFDSAGYNATTWNIGNLSGWNTSNVTNMSYMFYRAGNKTRTWDIGNLNGWDTSKVTNMSFLFSGAGENATIWNVGNLSGWNTSNVVNMFNMFSSTGKKATIWDIGDISDWNTTQVTNIAYMFSDAGYKSTIWNIGNIGKWTTSSVTDMSSMFREAGYNATTWNIGELNNWNTLRVTDMSSMFYRAGYNAIEWSIGDLSNWNTSSVTDMSWMFELAGRKTLIWDLGDLSGWNTSNVIYMHYMFDSAGYNATTWYIGDISNWNTSSLTNTTYMFNSVANKASTWTIGNLSNWNTSKLTSMPFMFSGAGKNALAFELDLSNWDTSKVTDMSGIFANLSVSANIYTTNWNTSNVTGMGDMFDSTKLSATIINGIISSLDTLKVTNMNSMFLNVDSITELDLNTFDVSKVKDMSRMFYDCSNLEKIDISSWNTDSLLKTYNSIAYFNSAGGESYGMFEKCSSLTTIYVGDGWNMSNVTVSTNMFKNSTHLVGGNGTVYDANHIDKEYARVDGNGGLGYLTYRSPFTRESWSTITSNVVSGNTSKYHVGDTKCIALEGFTTTNDNGCEDGEFLIRIANMSSPSECEASDFSESACGFVIEFVDIITTYNMNSTFTSAGSWPGSEMYKYINPIAGDESSGTIYKALPSELQSVIKDTRVVSGHGVEDANNFVSIDKLYLLATAEIWVQGSLNIIDYDSARDKTRQLDYYANLEVSTSNYSGAIKKQNGSNFIWWLRVPHFDYPYVFYYVDTSGAWYRDKAYFLNGVAVAFRIG